MGCVVAILMFIFFPIFYMWYQLRSSIKSFNEQNNYRQRERRTSNGTDTSSNPKTSTYNEKKKHKFKPGEGEYVDYQEME